VPPSPSTTTSTTTSTIHGDGGRDEEDEYENEENGSVVDTDLSGEAAFYASGTSHQIQEFSQLVRSASEEALPVSLSCDFSISGKLNLNKKQIRLTSDSFNGINKVISTSAVFPTTDQSFVADRTATATASTTTISASAETDAKPSATTSSDNQQLLHSSETLDRTRPQTISRFTVTLISKETTPKVIDKALDKDLKKSAKKKTRKKYPEYKV